MTNNHQKPRTAGRPSAYKPEYATQANKLCLLGATDADMADFFGVDESTINRWKDKHHEFCESIKKGKVVADANVAEALYKRAIGYSHKAEKLFQHQGEVIRAEYTEHYPPDTAAAFIWLKNRQPKKWRDKIEVKQEIEYTAIPTEELDAIHERAMKKAAEMQAMVAGRAQRLGLVVHDGEGAGE